MTVSCRNFITPDAAQPEDPQRKPGCFAARTVTAERTTLKPFRSTKGASKARRDHINTEIRNMRALLPISEEEKEHLSYLHTMSVVCAYIRKSLLWQGIQRESEATSPIPHEDFLQALPGFVVAVSSEGKLTYISDNVTEYLGISRVDLLQNDSFYDLIEHTDQASVKEKLHSDSSLEGEISFVCHMHTSKAFRMKHGNNSSVLVQGRFQNMSLVMNSSPVFIALCTPTVNRLQDFETCLWVNQFKTLHHLDMKFAEVPKSLFCHLGYSAEELADQSWYHLLHPDDLKVAVIKHKMLLQRNEVSNVEMVVRLHHKVRDWTWVYVRALYVSDSQSVACTTFIISEAEALFLRPYIHPEEENSYVCHNILNPSIQNISQRCRGQAFGIKRHQDTRNSDEEPMAKVIRSSLPSVCIYSPFVDSSERSFSSDVLHETPLSCTPPYSPSSDCSSFQSEDIHSSYFLYQDSIANSQVEGDRSLESFENLHSYYPVEVNNEPLVEPVDLVTIQPSSLEDVLSTDSALISEINSEGGRQCRLFPYDFSKSSDEAQLVPDSITLPEMSAGVSDFNFYIDPFSIPENFQESTDSYASYTNTAVFVPPAGILTTEVSPAEQNSFQYSEEERTEISLLARQISSLASSFDIYKLMLPALKESATYLSVNITPQLQHAYSSPGLITSAPDSVLDDSVIKSILKNLDTVPQLNTGTMSAAICPDAESSHATFTDKTQLHHTTLDSSTERSRSFSMGILDTSLGLGELCRDPPAGDSCALKPSCVCCPNELHQLDVYLNSNQERGDLDEDFTY
ncbi:neuronal PAS domain-containing protein 4-like [Polypterus senegalus]|uniref:neuronal PAS domain-containing protein 4-like n=1 Tax=Polypterus senegalus TaxID=55291 RepID=UPI001966BD27|nr:neuronal PAS domain-containing protein 4-like [Polypterus senegalus]